MYNSFRADEEKIAVWADFFKTENSESVMSEFRRYVKDQDRRKFPPNAPDLLPTVQNSNPEFERIMREQREDQKMLAQYTTSNDVIEMPDEIREKLERLRKKVTSRDG